LAHCETSRANYYLDKLGTSRDRFFQDDLEGFALRTSGASVTKSLTSTSSVQAAAMFSLAHAEAELYEFASSSHFQIGTLSN
jgi:hypothetical protein